jgi:hypothetical protein
MRLVAVLASLLSHLLKGSTSLALSGKDCSQHGGSVVAMHPRRTVRCYQNFVVSRGEDCRNSLQNAPSVWRQLSRPKKSVRVAGVIEE